MATKKKYARPRAVELEKKTSTRKTPKLIGEGRSRLKVTSSAQAKADSNRILHSRINKRILPKTHPSHGWQGILDDLDKGLKDKRNMARWTGQDKGGTITPSQAAETGQSGGGSKTAKVATGKGRTHMLSPKKPKPPLTKQTPYIRPRSRRVSQSV